MLILAAMLPAATVSAAQDETFMATLKPTYAGAPGTAQGSAYLFITGNGTEIRSAVSFNGLTGAVTKATLAVQKGSQQLLAADIGNGPSTIFRTIDQSSFQAAPGAASWSALLTAIRAGQVRVLLATSAHPEGELAGALESQGMVPAPSPSPTATPRPTARPVPPTDGEATGIRANASQLGALRLILLASPLIGLLLVWKRRPTPPSRRTRRTA